MKTTAQEPETLPSVEALLALLEVAPADAEKLSFSHKSPIQVRRYAETLAKLDPAPRAQKLYAAIKEVVALKESPEQRIKLLGIFHSQLTGTAQTLIEQTSVSRDANKVISLALALLKHLYSGYKQVIVSSASLDTANTGLLTNSIFSAVTVVNELFTCYWRHHLSPPASLWQELHSLFRLAQEYGLEDQRVSFVSTSGKPNATIRNAYLKILLAGSVCPPHYNAGELKQILQFIDDWAHLAKFGTAKQRKLFLVDPSANYGPVYRTRIKAIREAHISLCPKKLVSALQDRCVKSDSGVEYITVPDRLATDLSQLWSQENLRQEDHSKSKGAVDLVAGIDDIHRMLTGTEFGEEFFASLQQDANPAPEPSASVAGHWRYPSFRCEYLDQSEFGCCIEADGLREALAPGEIVVLIDPETEQQLSGVIRWAHNTNELKTRVGIQKFTGDLKACAVRLTRETTPITPYLPAFTIVSDTPKDGVHLLAPSGPLKMHNQIHMVNDQQEAYFVLNDKVEMTYHVSLFKITPEARSISRSKTRPKTRAKTKTNNELKTPYDQ